MGRPTNYSHETPTEIEAGYKYHVTLDMRNSWNSVTGTTEELYSLISTHSGQWWSSGTVSHSELETVSSFLYNDVLYLSGTIDVITSNVTDLSSKHVGLASDVAGLSAQVQDIERIYECLDLDAYASCVVDVLPLSSYTSCEWDYLIKSADNMSMRRGEMLVAWRSSDDEVASTEVSTPDIGNTDQVMMSVALFSGRAYLIASNSGPIDNWIIRVKRSPL
jgi:hypothetical protein